MRFVERPPITLPPMTRAEVDAALTRVSAQKAEREAKLVRLLKAEEVARTNARIANVQDLIHGTPETRAEVQRAADALEEALAAFRRHEEEGRLIEEAHRAVAAAVDAASARNAAEEDAAIRRHLEARAADLKEQLHAIVLDLDLLERARGRRIGPMQAATAHLDRRRLERERDPRRRALLKEIDNGR